jgi:flagellar hook-associated protein 2
MASAVSGLNVLSTAATTSSGGLDVNGIVSGLMAIERQPITALNNKVAADQAQLSVLGQIKSQIANFQSTVQGLGNSGTNSFIAYSASSSDTTAVTATAGSTAVSGSYTLNITTLAQANNLVAAGQTSNSSAVATSASTVTFKVGSTSTDVQIAAGASLADISSAINSANLGVTASIVNDGSATPYRLTLAANNTGLSNAINSITVKAGGDAAVNDLLAYNPTANAPAPAIPMTQKIAALDAVFTVNGIQITKASNTVTDAIPGVTLNLSKSAATATLTVASDTAAIAAKVSSFVTAYNSLFSSLKTSSAYKSGQPLEGDATLRSMQNNLRSILGTAVSGGTLTQLYQVGITFSATGAMTLDSTKLSSAMTSNFNDVANLFNSSTGYATKLDAWATTALQTGGAIDARTTSINNKITKFNSQIDTLNTRLVGVQKSYTTLYSNLNVLLAKMSSTSSYLTQQLKSA